MSTINYRLDVDQLKLTASSYTITNHLVQGKTLPIDYASGSDVTHAFGGFTLTLSPASPSTQMGFKLSQPGHPMNGKVGIAWGMIMISGSSDVFGQYELTVPISLDEKLSIRLGKI